MPVDNTWDAPSPDRTDDDFLAEIRGFLDCELTEDLRAAGRATTGVYSEIGAAREWHRRLYRQGWIAPAWPRAFGGAEWDARRRFLWDRECSRNAAPVMFATGVRSIGPLLIEAGTPAQRLRFLPRILSGEDLWCQGFSEPGAGSDLAALSTRAAPDGDDYVVDGTKIWTTGAHLANWMFAIVRTDDSGRRQEGLTFLLIDMKSPGVGIRPILGLAGEHEFNQVFFDGVRVPQAHRIGAENDGWAVAKRLMQLARSNNTPAALVRRAFRSARATIAHGGEAIEPSLRAELVRLELELRAFEELELAALPSGRPREDESATPSMLKLIGSELHQKMAELGMRAAGPMAMAAHIPGGLGDEDLDHAAWLTAKHLSVRAATIYSGASETQRNVIAKGMLGRL